MVWPAQNKPAGLSHKDWRRCGRKKVMPSKKAAERAAEAMQREYGDQRFEAYVCATCERWHVGRRKE